MGALVSILINSRIAQALALSALLALGGWVYGERRHAAGVRETAATYLKADMEGVKNVREISRRVLVGIGDDPDPDELLRQTGGLRDEPGNP